jgi:hypothetical protein
VTKTQNKPDKQPNSHIIEALLTETKNHKMGTKAI